MSVRISQPHQEITREQRRRLLRSLLNLPRRRTTPTTPAWKAWLFAAWVVLVGVAYVVAMLIGYK